MFSFENRWDYKRLNIQNTQMYNENKTESTKRLEYLSSAIHLKYVQNATKWDYRSFIFS